MKQIQPGDGANFTSTKEIADRSEGTMTGQKRKNVSPERKPPLSRNKQEPDRIAAVESAISKLQNLSQNWYLEDQYGRFKNTSRDS
jgi:hypothetical protein